MKNENDCEMNFKKIFRRTALESCPTVHLGGGPMTVSEDYLEFRFGGLSNRFYQNSVVVFENTKLLFWKQSFLTFSLGMREGVSEGSKSGKV